jgi:hypothetical protein
MSNMRVSGYLQAAGYPKSFKGRELNNAEAGTIYRLGNVVERRDEEEDSS